MRTVFLIFNVLALVKCKPLTMHEAVNYLQMFGYLHPERLSGEDSSEELEDAIFNAIKNFQVMAGIERTGVLNIQTREFMSQPRCGVPDMEALLDENGNEMHFKWRKNDLTYSIDNFWPEMTESEIRKTISDAFRMWSDVTPLTFKEVYSDNADFRLKFARGEHGDWSPFDGKGKILAHAAFPEVGKIHFNADQTWTRMNARHHPIHSHKDLFTTAVHEIGHAIGIPHVKDRSSIMYFTYNKPQDEQGEYAPPNLDAAIVRTVQKLYGKPKSQSERHNQPQTPTSRRYVPNIPQYCIRHITAIAKIPGNRFLVFPNSKQMITVNSLNKHIIGTDLISRIFTFGPFDVSSVVYSTKDSMILLFNRNLVYGFKFNPEKSTVKLAHGYPKILPTMQAGEFFWETKAAFIMPDGRRIIINTNKKVAVYNEHDNSIRILAGTIRDVFPKMPEDVIGFVDFSHVMHVGFTSTDVFKYDFEDNTVEKLGKIHDHMGC